MNEQTLAILGVTAGLLSFFSMFPYVRDILRGKTKPERATWWIWAVLSLVFLGAQWDAGATWSLGLTIGEAISLLIIAVLSLRYGYGKFTVRDYAAILIAGLGIAVWQLTDSPLAAILIVMTVDIAAYWLTLTKIWIAPKTETLSTWIMSVIAGALAVATVGEAGFVVLIYPLYVTVFDGAMTAIIISRRSIKHTSKRQKRARA